MQHELFIEDRQTPSGTDAQTLVIHVLQCSVPFLQTTAEVVQVKSRDCYLHCSKDNTAECLRHHHHHRQLPRTQQHRKLLCPVPRLALHQSTVSLVYSLGGWPTFLLSQLKHYKYALKIETAGNSYIEWPPVQPVTHDVQLHVTGTWYMLQVYDNLQYSCFTAKHHVVDVSIVTAHNVANSDKKNKKSPTDKEVSYMLCSALYGKNKLILTL